MFTSDRQIVRAISAFGGHNVFRKGGAVNTMKLFPTGTKLTRSAQGGAAVEVTLSWSDKSSTPGELDRMSGVAKMVSSSPESPAGPLALGIIFISNSFSDAPGC